MNREIPAYLYEKRNSIKMIIFTATFALLFINLFEPFGSRDWYPNVSDFKYFVFSSLIILTGMLVVVISRVILNSHSKKHPVIYWRYAVHILCEILAMAVFYTLFARYIPKNGVDREITEIFHQSITNTALILLLPYAISWLYFSWKDKSSIIENIEKNRDTGLKSKPLIAFHDEKGDLKLSIMLENLLYIESADNYANICYLNKSEISHFLLRNSLKWMEEQYSSDTPLTRCHRSYIVNMDKVKILKKIKGGIMLELDVERAPDIPVSKTYYDNFMNKFSQYSL